MKLISYCLGWLKPLYVLLLVMKKIILRINKKFCKKKNKFLTQLRGRINYSTRSSKLSISHIIDISKSTEIFVIYFLKILLKGIITVKESYRLIVSKNSRKW